MKGTHIVVAQPDGVSELEALRAFLKALKIKFAENHEKEYIPGFVSKILKGDEEIKMGKTTRIKIEDI